MFKPNHPTKPLSLQLTNEEVLLLIAELLPQQYINYSSHVIQRLSQPDRNFTEQKLLSIIKRPKSIAEPRWNDKYNNWTYTLEGYNKRHLVIAFLVDANNKLYIEYVTVF
jgi:hypothetical protein